MRLRNLIEDDDAVSPVIGVILMVAITVILAAVIASFVLGLGNSAGDVAPTASFTFEYDGDPGSSGEGIVTITHDGGENIRYDEVFIRGDGFGCSTCSEADIDSQQGWPQSEASGTDEDMSAVSSGDTLNVGVTSSYNINVVWDSKDTDSSTTLQGDSGENS